MSVAWGINGYAQAMIWPPIIRIFAEIPEKERKMKYCVDIVSSQVVGTLASYLMAAGCSDGGPYSLRLRCAWR